MIFSCCNEKRRTAVLAAFAAGNTNINGIDYLEVLDSGAPPTVPRQQTLLLHCLNPLSASMNFGPSPDGTYPVLIEGGESITNIAVDWMIEATAVDASPVKDINALQPVVDLLTDKANVLVVRAHEAGDFSTYRLRLVNSVAQAEQDPFAVTAVMPGFDPQLAAVEFSFKVECGPDFDCPPPAPVCAPAAPTQPAINYLAKDFGSFNTIIQDRLSQLLPGWNGGASEADLGVALAELIAYVGDHLSYQQDAVATEAYLETARRRVSLRRHALLVDYRVHDGCNARAWIHLRVSGGVGEALHLDRTLTRFYTSAPGIPAALLTVGASSQEAQAALAAGVQVFEPMHDAVLYPELNRIRFYTWGDTDCCLPQGAVEASLWGAYPRLVAGDVLIFEEVKGPQTGVAADADLRHRCAVRLTQVAILTDPLQDASGNLNQVTEIQWSEEDGLPFPLCISSTFLDAQGGQQTAPDVSVAYGNVVLADNGLSFTNNPLGTMPPPRLYYPPNPGTDRCSLAPATALPVRYRPVVPDSPLTQAVPLTITALTGVGNPVTPAVVSLGSGTPVDLLDANGFACLTLQASNPLNWPQNFGVTVASNPSNPPSFDLSVVYNPPGGSAGIHNPIIVEKFPNLTLGTVTAQIKTNSKLLQVLPPLNPLGALAGFPVAPTMLSNTGAVNLQDTSNPPVTYLTLEANNPASWPNLFGVLAKANQQTAANFDLSIVYDPPAGVGVTLPVTVEPFTDLSLADAGAQANPGSELVTLETFAQAPDPTLSAVAQMNFDASAALPSITLNGVSGEITTVWNPQPDLLESGASDPVFVVEVEADATATIRFGDNVNGKTPETGTRFSADYRIGNGIAGNVGADSLTQIVADPVSAARIEACRNPLPATGGIAPETNDQIRRRAPQAFLTQERAVTMADYAAMTELNTQVDRAAASLRWTGSWYTVFVAVEPAGGGNLTSVLGQSLKRSLERYRLAGQDLELDSAQYVSLQIGLTVCVDPDYFQADVEGALMQVLSNRILPNGQKGIFYPDNFTFGQTVYLSPVYAAARAVDGVLAVTATAFQPQGINTSQYLDAGEMKLGPLQVARLDNDPSFPDHGQLTLAMEGGK